MTQLSVGIRVHAKTLNTGATETTFEGSKYLDHCACNCLSQCLYELLCLRLRFSVFVWTLVLAIAFLNVCMDSCACACLSQCLHGLLCLCLRFSVFVWTLVLTLGFLSVCVDFCNSACALVSKSCMDSCSCTGVSFFSVCVLVLALTFLSVCIFCFACSRLCLHRLLVKTTEASTCILVALFRWSRNERNLKLKQKNIKVKLNFHLQK